MIDRAGPGGGSLPPRGLSGPRASGFLPNPRWTAATLDGGPPTCMGGLKIHLLLFFSLFKPGPGALAKKPAMGVFTLTASVIVYSYAAQSRFCLCLYRRGIGSSLK